MTSHIENDKLMNDISTIQSENDCLYYDFTKGDMEQQKHKLQQLQQRCQQQTLQQQQPLNNPPH